MWSVTTPCIVFLVTACFVPAFAVADVKRSVGLAAGGAAGSNPSRNTSWDLAAPSRAGPNGVCDPWRPECEDHAVERAAQCCLRGHGMAAASWRDTPRPSRSPQLSLPVGQGTLGYALPPQSASFCRPCQRGHCPPPALASRQPAACVLDLSGH